MLHNQLVSLGADESRDRCIGAVQAFLMGKGRLSYAAVTGTINQETANALLSIFGPTWESYPGGPCAVLAALQYQESTGKLPGGGQPYYMTQYALPSDNTLPLLIGAGLFVTLLIVMSRKG